jgi:hypothetical protein
MGSQIFTGLLNPQTSGTLTARQSYVFSPLDPCGVGRLRTAQPVHLASISPVRGGQSCTKPGSHAAPGKEKYGKWRRLGSMCSG